MIDFNRLPRGYQLRWPRELFRDELAQILDRGPFVQLAEQLRLLFEEAFVGSEPVDDVPGPSSSGLDAPAFQHGQHILDHLDKLPLETKRRYFKQRQAPADGSSQAPMPLAQRQRKFQADANQVLRELDAAGYFCQGMEMSDCIYDDGPSHAYLMQQRIGQRGGPDTTWPPTHLSEFPDQALSVEDFYTLLEILHDMVARPRSVQWHDVDGHDVYQRFDQHTGEAILRWRINTLFERYQLDFAIAAEGTDRGFVVSTVRDPRAQLEAQAASNTVDTDANGDLVAHAVLLFRTRHATTEDKRSACISLAAVLEYRRPLIKSRLHRKDEGTLFQIANEYRIRHHGSDQYADYGEEFLDWIFWNYLASIELTNRILARDDTAEASS